MRPQNKYIAWVAERWMYKILRKTVFIGLPLCLLAIVVYTYSKSPTHDRNWKVEHGVLPEAEINGNELTVKNIRTFTYTPAGEIETPSHQDRKYDIEGLRELWYGISHFHPYGLAHTFLSFGFEDGEYLSVSIEARQEKGEVYHPVTGLMRNYELMFVLADERDVIGVRTHHRGEQVYLYRLEVKPDNIRRMLLLMMQRVNSLSKKAEFYNTLTDNCTTSILKLVEDFSWTDIYMDYRVLLPGYSDQVAYEMGFLNADIPFAELKKRARLNPARSQINDPLFSKKIRGF